jgi:hypothetical protein
MGKAQCLCGALHAPQLFLDSGDGESTYVSLSVPGEFGADGEPEPLAGAEEKIAKPKVDKRQDVEKTAPSPSQEWMTFTSERYGYKFTVPSPGWRRCSPWVERKRGADLAVKHGEMGVLKCVVSECHLAIGEVYARLRVACEIEVEDFKLISKAREVVAGFPGARFEYEGTFPGGDGTKYRILRYALLKEGLLFQIVAPAPPHAFPRLKEETITAVRSFVFDQPAAKAVERP